MKKGIFHLLMANMLYLLISILNSFLLPKYLSIDTYAIIKTYTLYIGYAGFFSLGYSDGMYLKYGGRDIEGIEKSDFGSSLKSYILLEIMVSAICLILALVTKNFVFMAFALGCLFVNLIGYYKNLYQAVGEYKLYGKALNYQTAFTFALNVLFIFVLRSDNSYYYVAIQVGTAFLVMVYLTVLLHKRTSLLHSGRPSFKQIWEYVSSGFLLMLGNFSSSIFTGLDRWFVKFLLNSLSFAQYSFAVSLENIVNVFVTPITISLYNVFCGNRSPEYVRKIKRMVLLWGCVVIAAAFPTKLVVTYFLPNYTDALSLVFPLFGAQAFYTVIKGIHVNLYLAEKQQRRYFMITFAMIAVAVITNIVAYLILRSATAFALATFITAVIWFLYCEVEAKEFRFGINEYLTILSVMTGYFITTGFDHVFLGLGVYCCVLLASCLLFMRDTLKELWSIARSYINK